MKSKLLLLVLVFAFCGSTAWADEAHETRMDAEIQKEKITKKINAQNIAANKAAIDALRIKKGPQGPQGPIGLTGAQGPAGPIGPQGEPGALAQKYIDAICKLYSSSPSLPAFCPTPNKYVFVTSTWSSGNLGGITGADRICSDLATAAGLNGTFKAWLSSLTTNPSTTFFHSPYPYVTVDGTVVANNWADLTDGTITASINLDETGALVDNTSPAARTWTGTTNRGLQVAGSQYYTSCYNWTSSIYYREGVQGDLTRVYGDWSAQVAVSCATPRRLYCVQQ